MMCDCKDWKENIHRLDGVIALAWSHGMWREDFKSFIYCPYCGKKLTKETQEGIQKVNK
jgi:hypothetical protein